MSRFATQKQKGKTVKIPLRVKFLLLDETFSLGKISLHSSIRDLKSYIELATGIPAELQQLSYLDAGELSDGELIKNIEIVPNAIIHLKIWHTWKDLLFSMGVTQDSEFQTATSEYMLPKQRRDWLQHRASVALFIACQRVHYEMARRLIQSGANVSCQTGAGRTPLHVAAAVNNSDIVDLLLESGADIDLTDFGSGSGDGRAANDGRTAHDLAAAAGHKACERRLFMHRWEKRAYAGKPAANSAVSSATLSDKTRPKQEELLEFQRSDSSNPRWRIGPHGQVYMETMTTTGTSSAAASRVASRVDSGVKGAACVDREPTQASSISYEQWRHRKTQQRQKTDNSMASNPTATVGGGNTRHRQKQQQHQRMAQHPREHHQQQHHQHHEILLSQLIDATSKQGDQLRLSPNINEANNDQQQQQPPAGGSSSTAASAEPSVGRRRGPVDPQLNAYEQWLKDRSDGDAEVPAASADIATAQAGDSSVTGSESMLLPYQLMIEEFCREKCPTSYLHK